MYAAAGRARHNLGLTLELESRAPADGWLKVARADGLAPALMDGTARRSTIDLWDLMQLRRAVVIAHTEVTTSDGLDSHAVVWDGWRRVLFIGPGDFHGTQVSGSILVDEIDLKNRGHVDNYQGQTLSDYIRSVYGIERVHAAFVLMVNAKRVAGTHHM